MILSYEQRNILLDSARQNRLGLATVFLDRVLFSRYPMESALSARVTLSPFLFRFMLIRDYGRYGLSAFSFYTSHFDVDICLRAFSYRVDFPSGQMTLF